MIELTKTLLKSYDDGDFRHFLEDKNLSYEKFTRILGRSQ